MLIICVHRSTFPQITSRPKQSCRQEVEPCWKGLEGSEVAHVRLQAGKEEIVLYFRSVLETLDAKSSEDC